MPVRRVYGDPYEKNGVTVIPAARVQGGAGGGTGEGPKEQGGRGSGTGFGINAKPAGAFVLKGDDGSWGPAVDVNKVITRGPGGRAPSRRGPRGRAGALPGPPREARKGGAPGVRLRPPGPAVRPSPC